MRTLLVYHHKSGCFLEADRYLLQHISTYVDKICVVSPVEEVDVCLGEETGIEHLKTEEQGTIAAYAFAVTKLGQSELERYTRVLFVSDDAMGPIAPLDAFFRGMNESSAGVYGLELVEDGHMCPYFFAASPSLVHRNLQRICELRECVSYETLYEDYENDSFFIHVARHITEKQSPIISSTIFELDNNFLLSGSFGMEPCQIAWYIRKVNPEFYPLFMEKLIKSTPMSVLRTNLHYNYILPDKGSVPRVDARVALVCYIYYEDLIPYCLNYARSMPPTADIILITSNERMTSACEAALKDFPCANKEVRQMQNRGRDVAAYLVAARDVFSNYDYVCCMHDKKSPQYKRGVSDSFARHLFECNLASPSYVGHILETFENTPELGMLVPVFPHFGNVRTIGGGMFAEGPLVKELLKKLNFSIPYDTDVCAPLGTMFWTRGKAFMPMFNHTWAHEDFPPEPNRTTGTILHAIERFYPFAPQEAGYMVGFTSPCSYAAPYMDNLYWETKLWRQGKGVDLCSSAQAEPRIRMKDIRRMLKLYMKQLTRMALKRRRAKVHVRYLEKQGGSLLIFAEASCNDIYIRLIKPRMEYYPLADLTTEQREVQQFYRKQGIHAFFFRLPLAEIQDRKLGFFSGYKVAARLRWFDFGSYNFRDLNQQGLFVRILHNALFVESPDVFYRAVMLSPFYGIRAKLRFICQWFSRKKREVALFVENGGAADNSFELFKYAVEQHQDCYYIGTKEQKIRQRNPELKKRMLLANSRAHLSKFLSAGKIVSSFSFRHYAFPYGFRLQDIHLQCGLPEWIMIPHGYTGDKYSILLHKCIWDKPARVFCCNQREADFFQNVCGFSHTRVTGFPRMDKWVGSCSAPDKILVFFTWRFSLSRLSEDQFRKSAYFKHVERVMQMLEKRFFDRTIYYVFHHEVVRWGYDRIIREALKYTKTSFIYLQNQDGVALFNRVFRDAKYLITDLSSVAYDFGYKEESIPIYYMPDDFVLGHYEILPAFYDIHLGVLTRTEDELVDALKLRLPTPEMNRRREAFFPFLGGGNCERVFSAIFREQKAVE